jgi:hypothetical protein
MSPMTHIRLDVPTCSDVEMGPFRVIFRNIRLQKIGRSTWALTCTDTQISKIESEPSVEDLIYQERSFFLLNPNRLRGWHGIGRKYLYTSERDWVIGSDSQLFEAVEVMRGDW